MIVTSKDLLYQQDMANSFVTAVFTGCLTYLKQQATHNVGHHFKYRYNKHVVELHSKCVKNFIEIPRPFFRVGRRYTIGCGWYCYSMQRV